MNLICRCKVAATTGMPRKEVLALAWECWSRTMRVLPSLQGTQPPTLWKKGRDASTLHTSCTLDGIRHSDRHAPGRTQERHLHSKIR